MKIPSPGSWTFESKEIAEAFDDHVREQLPWYDLATGVVSHLIRHYLPENGVLYDVGASTGNITRAVSKTINDRAAKVIALEPSNDMVSVYMGEGSVITEKAEEHEFEEFDVAVMFLTMMFVPVRHRHNLLERIKAKCRPGGCIVIFDKTNDNSGYLSTVINRLTIAGKVANNTPPDQIIKKELSLSGCQRPYSCESHGAVEIFRFGDFAGWIIEV